MRTRGWKPLFGSTNQGDEEGISFDCSSRPHNVPKLFNSQPPPPASPGVAGRWPWRLGTQLGVEKQGHLN